jgi:glycosyltransferase involved in cell wall biosynthesis
MAKKKKHILVVCQYFYPEQFRINDICTEWIKRGYKVTVLTGIPNYPQGEYYEGYDLKHKRTEEWNGVKIVRIPLIARGHNSFGLACNYASFVVSGFIWKIFAGINADCVFNYELSPMTQALVGVWYAKKRKIPCYLYVTDLWPDNVEIVTGIHNKQIMGSINMMVNYIYKRCTRVFASSESFVMKMVERGVPREKLQFWPQYAEDFYFPYKKVQNEDLPKETGIPDDGIFNVVFAGNIGYAQGLGVLVLSAKYLKKKNKQVRFNIVGEGRYKEQMLADVKTNQLDEFFNFIERQPAENIPKFMAAGDAALICLSKSEVFAMTIPAKTQSCLACGMPILVSADGEIRSIVEAATCGFTSAAEDAESLAENIIKMSELSSDELKKLGANSTSYYKRHFDKKMLLDEMDKYMKGSN